MNSYCIDPGMFRTVGPQKPDQQRSSVTALETNHHMTLVIIPNSTYKHILISYADIHIKVTNQIGADTTTQLDIMVGIYISDTAAYHLLAQTAIKEE